MAWFTRRKKPSNVTSLHIDDSRWVRIPVSILLRREFGMRVLEAESGLEGLKIAEQELPDLILLDVMMPQLDGFDTLQKLKDQRLTRDIPVIMCTARDNVREVNIALRLGAFAYLTKPIEEDRLIVEVGRILTQIQQKQLPGGSIINYEERLPQPVQEVLLPAQRSEVYSSPAPPPKNLKPPRHCPRCRLGLELIHQYNAWYCHPCQMYPDFEHR